jgi:lambda repressor-like predicted transcriptional regulator
MHPEDIKSLLRKRGTSSLGIAKALGLAHSTVSNTISRRGKSASIEKAIAEALGKQTWEVFPDRYPVPNDAPQPEMLLVSRAELADMKAAMSHAIKLIDSAREFEIA